MNQCKSMICCCLPLLALLSSILRLFISPFSWTAGHRHSGAWLIVLMLHTHTDSASAAAAAAAVGGGAAGTLLEQQGNGC